MKQRIQGIIIGILIMVIIFSSINIFAALPETTRRTIEVDYGYNLYMDGELFAPKSRDETIELFNYKGWIWAPFEHIVSAFGGNARWESNTRSLFVTTKTASDVVQEMGAGWNLGNTLDSIDNRKRGIVSGLRDNIPAAAFYETYWGNPVTTPEMIASVAEMGFGAVRVPVTWSDHLDEDFNIRLEWLARVEEIVNYVLDNDMYCIINLHHDTGSGSWPWLRADPDKIEWMEEKLAKVWTQIAEHFKYYSHRLLFESFNEILDVDSRWGNPDRESLRAVNRLNQVFVNTVRSTGSNNAERFLVVKPYAARTSADLLDAFKIPEDSVKDKLILGVHVYGEAGFIANPNWTAVYSDWDRVRDGHIIEERLQKLADNFLKNGFPVIITEYGAVNKNNTVDRINYAVHFAETAKQYGIAGFWWDDGGRAENAEFVENHALFDRYRNRWFFPEIAEAIVNAAR